MRGLTLWQPWATLLAVGHKVHETRSWSTPYRGPVLIHAAKRWGPEQAALLHEEPYSLLLEAHLSGGKGGGARLPLGAVVGVMTLDACVPAELAEPDPVDAACGHFAPGRYAWRAGEVWRVEPPVPTRGAQGLWPVKAELLERVRPRCRPVRIRTGAVTTKGAGGGGEGASATRPPEAQAQAGPGRDR